MVGSLPRKRSVNSSANVMFFSSTSADGRRVISYTHMPFPTGDVATDFFAKPFLIQASCFFY